MRILILEDDENRNVYFRRNFAPNEIVITDDSKECIKLLVDENWDMLFLDHDLGGQQMVSSGENTGYEVAQFLEENSIFVPPRVVIHSFNPIGARNMHQALPRATVMPGAWTRNISEF
jgi:hypothetical protein